MATEQTPLKCSLYDPYNLKSASPHFMPLAPLLNHFKEGVLIATRHQLMLAAMQAMADATPTNGLKLTASCHEALRALESQNYSLLICTQSLQSGTGIQLAKKTRALYPELPILFFLTIRMEALILREADLYCNALIAEWDLDHQESPLQASLAALEHGKKPYRSPSIRALLEAEDQESKPATEPLTPREQTVLQLILTGHSNQEIAESLILSPSTVKSYSRDVMRKLGVKNRQQAVLRAMELGFLDTRP